MFVFDFCNDLYVVTGLRKRTQEPIKLQEDHINPIRNEFIRVINCVGIGLLL